MHVYLTLGLAFVGMLIVSVAIVFIAGTLMMAILNIIDGLDGEIGENDGPKIIDEFRIPETSDDLEKFKQKLLEDRDKMIQEFVLEDLKDGILGNLRKDKF